MLSCSPVEVFVIEEAEDVTFLERIDSADGKLLVGNSFWEFEVKLPMFWPLTMKSRRRISFLFMWRTGGCRRFAHRDP